MNKSLKKPNKLTKNQHRDYHVDRGRNNDWRPWYHWSENMAAKKIANCKKLSSQDAGDRDPMSTSISRVVGQFEYRKHENDQARVE